MAEILETIPEIDSPENHINDHRAMEDWDGWKMLNTLNMGRVNNGNIYKGYRFAPGAYRIVNRHRSTIKVTNCSNLR